MVCSDRAHPRPSPRMDTSALAREFGVSGYLESHAYMAALEALVPALYDPASPRRAHAVALRDAILTELRHAMRTATHPPRTRMRFGTSGWRGILYEDFTVHNVACVTQALVDTVLDPATHAALGVGTADEVRGRGAVVAHDRASWDPSSPRWPRESSWPTGSASRTSA